MEVWWAGLRAELMGGGGLRWVWGKRSAGRGAGAVV